MAFELKTYKNSTELANLNGCSIYMNDMIDAALRGRLNVFLQGDTGSGKTQLARNVMDYFGDNAIFFLGRNDADTRELFTKLNLAKLNSKPKYNLEPLVNPNTGELEWYYPQMENNMILHKKLSKEQADRVKNTLDRLVGTTEDIKELTSKINANLIIVDELPNCVPSVRAQFFNMFDGFIEIDGKNYPIGNNYSVGIATGNLGQHFTESSNELGRALKDRMHLIIDTDYFMEKPIDTLEILMESLNPRVNFGGGLEEKAEEILESHKNLKEIKVPFEKYIIANYLRHGLNWLPDGYGGSKIALKSGWPNKIESHDSASDLRLILPVSPRAAKSIVVLSQALDEITKEKGAREIDYFNSMMTAFKFVSAYSGVLNEADVNANHNSSKYKAMDSIIDTTRQQFQAKKDLILAGFEMAKEGKKDDGLLSSFDDRWGFMKNILENIGDSHKDD